MTAYCREPGCIQDAYAGVYCREHGAVPAKSGDTHRIVPVEVLTRIEGVLSVSEYWSHNVLGEELRAIIETKP
jgi:hypothetical protein